MALRRVSTKDRAAASAAKEPVFRLERVIDKVPYITGFCSNGGHEGTKKLSDKGTLLRACSGSFLITGKTYNCRCNCHEVFRQIFEMTGMTTQTVAPAVSASPPPPDSAADIPVDLIGSIFGPRENNGLLLGGPTPAPNHREAPVTATTTASIPGPPVTAPGVSSLRPLLPPAQSAFSATKSGQRARGQLEAEVANVAMRWFREADLIPLTPDNVAAAVPSEPRPSVGAVYSIFQRWSKQGWAELGTKPFRMIRLTEQGKRGLARWS